nr:hypothetical protein [Candidatus Sigynarchaeota archaeon]
MKHTQLLVDYAKTNPDTFIKWHVSKFIELQKPIRSKTSSQLRRDTKKTISSENENDIASMHIPLPATVQQQIEFYEIVVETLKNEKKMPISKEILFISLNVGWVLFLVGVISTLISASSMAITFTIVGIFLVIWFFIMKYDDEYRKINREIREFEKKLYAAKKRQEISAGKLSSVQVETDPLFSFIQANYMISLDALKTALNMNSSEFDAIIVDWSIEFGFWIDGDNLVLQDGNVNGFIKKLRDLRAGSSKIQNDFEMLIDGKTRVALDDLKRNLGINLDQNAFDEKLVEWASQFRFKIDGDELVLDGGDVAGFLKHLQELHQKHETETESRM